MGTDAIKSGKTKTKSKQKIFDPMIFPRASVDCFFQIAISDVLSSGKEVPIASMVNPMITSGILKIKASPVAPHTINSEAR